MLARRSQNERAASSDGFGAVPEEAVEQDDDGDATERNTPDVRHRSKSPRHRLVRGASRRITQAHSANMPPNRATNSVATVREISSTK